MNVRVPALEKLLGKSVEDPLIQDLLNLASPVSHVSSNSPPLLIMHGLQDNQVPINQSLELQDAYLQQNLNIEAQWLPNAQHDSNDYFETPYVRQVADFLRRVL
jgi:dipeptidyl aminopeptidase/acylaminoacyl peptidase